GDGRMAEPDTIVDFIQNVPGKKTSVFQRLKGKKALVTAGPTHESIDPVRFISNHSSGKMGIAIAEQLAKEGADVELVLGPSAITPANHSIRVKQVTSANEMFEVTMEAFKKADITIMSAAVADYTPEKVSPDKIKKGDSDTLKLSLKKTPDILKALGK